MEGVRFGNHHSYRAWRLLLKSKPEISPPVPQTKLVKVPGSNTVIDLTESLTGEVKYETRSIRCVFLCIDGRERWAAAYSAVLNAIHGKRMRITMDDDANWYYIGRVAVDTMGSDEASATIAITAEVEPYKYARHGAGRRL